MTITSEHIRGLLKQTWPNLYFIWPTNPKWEDVSDYWMLEITANCSVRHMTSIPGIWECENYGHQFKARVEKYQYDLYQSEIYKPKWRWAIGEIIGIQSDIFGNPVVHEMNVILTEHGLVLYEPQEDVIKKSDYTFVPFFVKF